MFKQWKYFCVWRIKWEQINWIGKSWWIFTSNKSSTMWVSYQHTTSTVEPISMFVRTTSRASSKTCCLLLIGTSPSSNSWGLPYSTPLAAYTCFPGRLLLSLNTKLPSLSSASLHPSHLVQSMTHISQARCLQIGCCPHSNVTLD